uniref:Uncharacterized protein n=1 Tax=Hemiselmis tepida TaxID=464990 RepID=A0A7S0VV58_9CRYP
MPKNQESMSLWDAISSEEERSSAGSGLHNLEVATVSEPVGPLSRAVASFDPGSGQRRGSFVDNSSGRKRRYGKQAPMMSSDDDGREIVMGPSYLRFLSLWGAVDPARPVKSMDHLFLQAGLLSKILRGHVVKLASLSNGMFKFQWFRNGFEEEATFESWKEVGVTHKDGRIGGVRWTAIKSIGRATEKVVRSYGGDVSRLVDVCRESIVFENVSDLTRCLQLICEDPDLEVLRVKNRLRRDFDPWSSCGYRNVSLNVRVITDITTKFGVDTHVCEVQLLLRSFALQKTAKSHKRYVQFRDFRGE